MMKIVFIGAGSLPVQCIMLTGLKSGIEELVIAEMSEKNWNFCPNSNN